MVASRLTYLSKTAIRDYLDGLVEKGLILKRNKRYALKTIESTDLGKDFPFPELYKRALEFTLQNDYLSKKQLRDGLGVSAVISQAIYNQMVKDKLLGKLSGRNGRRVERNRTVNMKPKNKTLPENIYDFSASQSEEY